MHIKANMIWGQVLFLASVREVIWGQVLFLGSDLGSGLVSCVRPSKCKKQDLTP